MKTATKRSPTTFERRACAICGRTTVHKVIRSRNGMGRTLAEVAECLHHRAWADGRIDVRRNGEWVTVRAATPKI